MSDIRKALEELVALKDLKDKAERGVTVMGDAAARGMCASFDEQAAGLGEYERRKPLAWAAARAALAQPQAAQPEAVAHDWRSTRYGYQCANCGQDQNAADPCHATPPTEPAPGEKS